MNYKGRDIELRSGDILLYRNEFVWYKPMTYISTAIRFFTKVKYNHVAIVVSSWDTLMINEAKEWGVIARPLESHLERYKSSIMVLRPKAVNEREICTRANSKLGAAYDFKTLLWDQLWYRITKVWRGQEGEAAAGSFVCSEYVAWCYDLSRFWIYSAKELMENNDFEKIEVE